MSLGTTFKIIGDTADDHLWMVISHPCAKTNKCVLVNLTGWIRVGDQTCLVDVGEHPYVKKRSLVFYPGARMYTPEYITKLRQAGLLDDREDLAPGLLKKVQIGSILSPHFPIIPKEIMKAQFGQLMSGSA